MTLALAYISGIVCDQPGKAGFTVNYGTSDAMYSSTGTFHVDMTGTEGEILEAVRVKVAQAVNAALGLQLTSEDVRLF